MLRLLLGTGFLGVAALSFWYREDIGDEITAMSTDFLVWDERIKEAARSRNVPWRWLKAIMWNESDLGRENSVIAGMLSPGSIEGWSEDKKSRGVMQLTLDTANRRRVRPGTTLADLDNPLISLDCGAAYVSELMRFYFPNDREGVIRGYNGGPGWRNASAESLDMTQKYYERFLKHLETILAEQPGNEME